MPKKQANNHPGGEDTRRNREDALYYRILGIIVAAAVVELSLMLIQRGLNSSATVAATHTLLLVLQYTFFALAVIFLVVGMLRAASKTPRFVRVPAGLLTVVCVFLAVICLAARAAGSSVLSSLSIAVVFAIAACFIFFACQRDFFYTALIAGVSILALMVMRAFLDIEFYAIRAYLSAAAALVVIAGIAVMSILAHRRGGVIRLPGREYLCLTPGMSRIPLIVMTGVSAACLILSLFTGTAIAYYSIFVVAGCLFVCAVYYIVKLIQN